MKRQISKHLILCEGVSSRRMPSFKTHRLSLGKEVEKGQIRLDFKAISQKMVQDIPPIMRDLLEVATFVYVADQVIGRGGEKEFEYGDKWDRVLHFKIPVREHCLWSHCEVSEQLQDLLGFLSGDTYLFTFVPRESDTPEYFEIVEPDNTDYRIEDVVLFSGGLDSFTGVVDEVVDRNSRIAMVSHHSNSKAQNLQMELTDFIKALPSCKSGSQAIQVKVNKEKELTHEKSQRSRSFLFAALGTVIAYMYDLRRVKFYENGIVTCHLPFDGQAPQGRRTRSTHPKFLREMGSFVSTLINDEFSFENPYFGLTKTDVVLRLMKLGHQIQIERTRSCAGAIFRYPQTHCGLCSQCLDRRFATLAARCAENDSEQLYKVELFLGQREKPQERALAAGFVDLARRLKAMSPEHFARAFMSELTEIKSGFAESAENVFLGVHELHRRHAQQLMGVVSEHIGKYSEMIAEGALPSHCLLDMIVKKQHLDPKEVLEMGSSDMVVVNRARPRRSKSGKKTTSCKFKKWAVSDDACFVVDGTRKKFHLDGVTRDMRLRSGSRAEKLLHLLMGSVLSKDEVKASICTNKTKPFEAVRDVNRLLNRKIQGLGFAKVPANTEFIGRDRSTGQYFSHLPIKTQDEFEWG